MEPMKPSDRAKLLQVVPEPELREYERLLSERFTVDPDLQLSPQAAETANRKAVRLRELAEKVRQAKANLP